MQKIVKFSFREMGRNCLGLHGQCLGNQRLGQLKVLVLKSKNTKILLSRNLLIKYPYSHLLNGIILKYECAGEGHTHFIKSTALIQMHLYH